MFTDDLAARIDGRLTELALEAERLTTARAHLVHSAPEPTRETPKPTSVARRRPARAKRGRTNELVLNALVSDEGRTAGEIEKATGVSRAVAGSTLTRLAKQGLAAKAARGYVRTA